MITQIAKDACIILWGHTMYLDYDSLPRGGSNIGNPDLEQGFKELIEAFNNDTEELNELCEWFNEGASYGGKILLTLETYDTIMKSNQTILNKDIVIYRSGKFDNLDIGYWLSVSTIPGAYSFNDLKERKFTLKTGTAIINTKGYADKGEIIIQSDVIIDLLNESFNSKLWIKPFMFI